MSFGKVLSDQLKIDNETLWYSDSLKCYISILERMMKDKKKLVGLSCNACPCSSIYAQLQIFRKICGPRP